jgi:hypothetical protein
VRQRSRDSWRREVLPTCGYPSCARGADGDPPRAAIWLNPLRHVASGFSRTGPGLRQRPASAGRGTMELDTSKWSGRANSPRCWWSDLRGVAVHALRVEGSSQPCRVRLQLHQQRAVRHVCNQDTAGADSSIRYSAWGAHGHGKS